MARSLSARAGFKMWPREVEDVCYEHPAVREAAVVGVPDTYRGETVRTFVSLREEVSSCPKTLTGKILRRALRME